MDTTAVLDPYGAMGVLRDVFRCAPEDSGEAQLAEELRVLQVMRNWIDGRAARALGVFDARAGASSQHARSTSTWVQHTLHVSATTAAGRVSVARRARVSDRLASAMESGSIGYDHAVAIARALDKLPPAARDSAEEILLATAVNIDPGRLRHVADTIREALAPELLVTETETAFDDRHVSVSTTIGGRVVIDGVLDPEGGALVESAINAYATPAGPHDKRTAGQRRADALVDVIRAGLGAATLPVTGGERPHVTLTTDFDRFLDRKIPTAWTSGGAILAGETVRRILCDARITRVVTSGASEVLDIGRATRVWPPAMRRALAIRDGGCVALGCDRPPAFTDAHHVVHWEDGGPTSVANGALLCRYHHDSVHNCGWALIRTGPGWIAVPPDLAAINAEAAATGCRLPILPNPGLLPPWPPSQREPDGPQPHERPQPRKRDT